MADLDSGTIYHGGDLAGAEATFGAPAGGWLDLSTGINPNPYPVDSSIIAPALLGRLPGTDALEALKNAARSCYDAPARAHIVVAPGTQALIQWLPHLRQKARVAIHGFCYGEHLRAWRGAGHDCDVVEDLDGIHEDYDVVVSVVPNNPTGRIVTREELLQLAERLSNKGGFLVVDGAFADTVAESGVSVDAGLEGLVVLRSFGKFFGLAGVRLGFALTSPVLGRALEQELGPWAVSGPAIAAGSRALGDTEWIRETKLRLEKDAKRLDLMLTEAGLILIGGTTLFRLFRHSNAISLFEHLAHLGILVRPFPEKPTWLRFGLPGNEAEFEKLHKALGSWCQKA